MTAEERRGALSQVIARGSEDAAEVIGDALRDSHWPACDELAAALARIAGDAGRAQLLRALEARRHHVRSAAVKALASLGGRGVRDQIAELRDDPSYEVRQDVAEALAALPCAGEGTHEAASED